MSHPLRIHIDKITPLSDAEFDYILSHFKPKKLKKHQFLVQEGQLVTNDHFVIKGLLKSYFTHPEDGKEHILQLAVEDWWISDYQALFKQSIASLNIDCVEEVEVLCLSLTNREKLCSELHKMEHFFRIKSNGGYVGLQQRLLSLLTKSAKERYNQLIEQQPQLLQRLPKSIIASYLGVSRETLSRLYSGQ